MRVCIKHALQARDAIFPRTVALLAACLCESLQLLAHAISRGHQDAANLSRDDGGQVDGSVLNVGEGEAQVLQINDGPA